MFMRWSIRYQLLVPLLTLLLGVVVGITAWSAVAAVRREQSQIEAQVRSVAHTLSRSEWHLTDYILHLTKDLSGAEYLVVSPAGKLKATTLNAEIRGRL